MYVEWTSKRVGLWVGEVENMSPTISRCFLCMLYKVYKCVHAYYVNKGQRVYGDKITNSSL